jgi:hypothetical protein
VSHALTAHLGLNNLYSALLAHDSTVTETLILTADTFIVLYGTEDLGAKEAIALRLERTVVDRLRLGYLAEGPSTYPLWAR